MKRRRLAWTRLDEVSPAMTAAVIASEDRRFRSHRGVDWLAVARSAVDALRGGRPRGASTISMQVAALLRPDLQRRDRPRSVAKKLAQIRAARGLERSWSKDQILEAYLNLAVFRGELQGIAAASSLLFGKSPHGLDAAEAAVLAALLRSPNAGEEAVLRRASELDAPPLAVNDEGGRAHRHTRTPAHPHTRTAVAVEQLRAASAQAAGRVAFAPHAARQLLDGKRATDVASTLDLDLQRFATDTLRLRLLALRDRNVADGAVLVADNSSGDILAYVGSSGDLSHAPHVDGIRARRQAGSSLKPFLYGLALDRRLLHAASLLEDAPFEVAVGGGLYRPSNYDERFGGLVTVRKALAGSLNVPAVRTLELVGKDAFVRQLRRLGFTGIRKSGDFYGPSLALGSADVTLWELAGAYRTLANGGVWTPLRIRAGSPAAAAQRAYSAEAAFLVSHILSDRESRGVAFGLESSLDTRFWSAVKTGTSKDMRDNWCVGYSERYTVGVWVGNFSGEPMRDVSGVSGAAPIWNDVLSWLHRQESSRAPAPPPGVIAASIGAEGIRSEWFLPGTEPVPSEVEPSVPPSITAPVDGTVIAVDPDIPAERQRVRFSARNAGGTRWELDGLDLGPVNSSHLWKPAPGRHVLRLIDGSRRPLDHVGFLVRALDTR
jgi:penicillin-binding protein 1C